MSKVVLFGKEAREKLAKGINILADAVRSTLGPRGRNVVIEKPYQAPHVTKDGVTVAREISLADPVENMGAEMIRQAASTTADSAGDGTTTSTVLAQQMISEGLSAIEGGANPIDIKRGMDRALKDVVAILEKQSEKIDLDSERVQQVATISANNDPELGRTIAKAIKSVGTDGVVLVEESKSPETTVDYLQGITFDRGYMSEKFVTNPEKMVVEYHDPVILFIDENVKSIQSVLPVIEACNTNGVKVPLVIIADDIIEQALNMLIANKMTRGLEVVAIKAPSFGDNRKDVMQDMAIATGGVFLSDSNGKNLDQACRAFEKTKSKEHQVALLQNLGQCEKITVGKHTTTIVGNAGKEEEVQIRVGEIKAQMQEASADGYKAQMKERIAKLTGGVAVIYVGAATEIEMKEKKDRVDDAVAATQAALLEGIVAGGGLTLAKCFAAMRDLDDIGYTIVANALYQPMLGIMENAGANEDATTKAAVVIHDDRGIGYDALNDVWVNLKDEGIIDPVKVTRVAVENAVSVASTVLTTNVTVNMEIGDRPKDVTPDFNGMGF